MKFRSQFTNGTNNYEVYFAYEDYYGGEKFGTYDDMVREGEIPNLENKHGMLVGYIHSFYWGTTERIDMLKLKGKPTTDEVKNFIKNCYNVLNVAR